MGANLWVFHDLFHIPAQALAVDSLFAGDRLKGGNKLAQGKASAAPWVAVLARPPSMRDGGAEGAPELVTIGATSVLPFINKKAMEVIYNICRELKAAFNLKNTFQFI